MTKPRKIILAVVGMPLACLIAVFLPLYPFIAEDVPLMRPFGWSALPETQPYTEGEVAPGYRDAADRARGILRAHIREIDVPAFSAAVAVKGRLVWSAAAGYANLEQREKATPEHVNLFRTLISKLT